MRSAYDELVLETRGDGDVVDVTADAQKLIAVFVAHSTCGVTTIEHEPGCDADLGTVLESITPRDARWEHNIRNSDTNGHSHVRAALVGPSVTVPFRDGELQVGVWQKIVCVDFDDRPRTRKIVVQLLGE